MMPLHSDEPNVGYCTYSQTLSKQADAGKMTELSYETTANVLATCIKLRGASNFQRTMDEVIRDVRAICNAAHGVIMLIDFNHRTCSVLCEDLVDNQNLCLMRDTINADFYEFVESWADTIAGSNCLVIKDPHDMKVVQERNAGWYETMHRQNVESMVLFPLRYGGDLLGYIWVTNFDTRNLVRIKETLELTAFFLASEIANHQFVKRLETLGAIDLLTGVLNRNAMNNRVTELVSWLQCPAEAIGVVFADLNGLKQVNEHDGHYSGDLLLKNAALILQKIFVGNEIYRAGGDEFMIIAIGITEEELERRVRLLQMHPAVSFAVGSYYEQEGRNIRKAMRMADEKMYEDKARFYRLHPERRH
jgi:diguanylate cyclase (GGDEF)-like protein